jgi:hypothetical protein
MVNTELLTTRYQLIDGVEILVKDMTDEQVREMLEVDNVTIRQLRAAAYIYMPCY